MTGLLILAIIVPLLAAAMFALSANRERQARAAAEQRLRDLEAAPQQTSDERLRFLGIVAHELRSPLTAIMGYQELIQDGIYGPIDDRARDALQRIGHSARQMLVLADGMEELAGRKDTTADETLNDEAADFLSDCIADLTRDAAARNVPLEIQTPLSIEPLAGDPERARSTVELVFQAALKLVTTGTLQLGVRNDPGSTTITLDGPGLDRYPLGPEFDATTPASRIDSGAALRLAIARRHARALGGDLTTPAGAAARLELRLPTARTDRPRAD